MISPKLYKLYKLVLVIGSLSIPWRIALNWMSLDRADDKSVLVQVMVLL